MLMTLADISDFSNLSTNKKFAFAILKHLSPRNIQV